MSKEQFNLVHREPTPNTLLNIKDVILMLENQYSEDEQEALYHYKEFIEGEKEDENVTIDNIAELCSDFVGDDEFSNVAYRAGWLEAIKYITEEIKRKAVK